MSTQSYRETKNKILAKLELLNEWERILEEAKAEAELIKDEIKAEMDERELGKMVAKQNPNFKDGRPKKYTPIQVEHVLSLLSSGKSYKEAEAITGISKSTMIRAKNKEGAV